MTVNANATSTKTITNTLKQPHTSIKITADTYETSPGENVVITISDKNDGFVPLTNPSVDFFDGVSTTTLNSSTTGWTDLPGGNGDNVMDVGETWTWTVNITISVNTVFSVAGHGLDPFGNDISPTNGYTTEAGAITVKVIGTTRTLGFWQTHTNFTDYVAGLAGGIRVGNAGSHKGGSGPTGALSTSTAPLSNELLGGFYAPMSKKTTGEKRLPADKARINLLQQLLAAKLNCAAFGCSSATQTLISSADAAYVAGVKSDILYYAGLLDTFNNSGDAFAIPSSLPATGKATPALSTSYANLTFWNTP